MKIALDCEFNGFGGELISMALVSEDGHEFYEVLQYKEKTEPWVLENVIPILGKEPVSKMEFQTKLTDYFCQYAKPIVIADWHEDIKFLCDQIIIGPGIRLPIPDMEMHVRNIEAGSKIPHNALEDARGIMEWLLEEEYSEQ